MGDHRNRRKDRWRWKEKQNQRATTEHRGKTAGYVYVFEANGVYKIGITGNVDGRLRDMRIASPFIREVFSVRVEDCRACERHLHKAYQGSKVGGEWFKLKEETLTAIREFLQSKQPEGHSPHDYTIDKGLRFASTLREQDNQ
jgi:hypothetical protein